MPEKVKLSDGTEKTVYSEEEVKEIQQRSEERKKQREEAKAIAEAISKEKDDISERLKGFENKDFNFKKLRDMNDEEKAKLSEAEISLKKQQELLEEKQGEIKKQQDNFTSQLVDSFKSEALAVLCGDDNEIRKKVLLNYDKIKGDVVKKDEVFKKVKDAYNMLGIGNAPDINPFSAINSVPETPSKRKQSPSSNFGASPGNTPAYASNSVDPDLARGLGINEKDLETYDKHPYKGSDKETGKKPGFAKD